MQAECGVRSDSNREFNSRPLTDTSSMVALPAGIEPAFAT